MSERSRLIRMTITNIGCIGPVGLTVELDNIVCLVGANNSGKTTVLRAYELAVNQSEMKPDDFNCQANGLPATVELWVHIPEGAGNVDAKWKEKKDDLLLVRSKWEWPEGGSKPVRTTWDPSESIYAENGKASGLDTVFNSRLPKPFRIGSLENPEDEHKKLLTLVLEPVVNRFKWLMQDQDSDLCKKLLALQAEAEKPVSEFREELCKVESQVNTSYRRVFSTAEIKLNISLGEITFDPSKSLTAASRVDIAEAHGQTRWNQQGTGSQRALFWSMLQVRSELNRITEERKQKEKTIEKAKSDLAKAEKKLATLKKDEARAKCEKEIADLKAQIESSSTGSTSEEKPQEIFLPGYMLLIDEPETALHPSAVRAAKEHLYSLAAEAGWQVMLSTHHPAFVDPLKDHTTIVRLHRLKSHLPPNIYRSDAIVFSEDEQQNLKSLLAFDVSVAEMFFGARVLIVEGDTEFAAFSEVMNTNPASYPMAIRPLIIRARGKATIPTLVKMLTHFKIDFAVLHDIDSPKTQGGKRANPAYSINTKISEAIYNARQAGVKVIYRCSCPNFEQQHGMKLPEKDKPYESWKAVRENNEIKESVRRVIDTLIDLIHVTEAQDDDDGRNFETIFRNWVKAKEETDPDFLD